MRSLLAGEFIRVWAINGLIPLAQPRKCRGGEESAEVLRFAQDDRLFGSCER